ncbi:MAG: hypothetical protein IH983_01675 [Planctomycetes bacterium]|nr:hypothetical protein [Planctomycetota bacterium]
MRADVLPLRMLLLAVSGWVNRSQQDVIENLADISHLTFARLHRRAFRARL